MDWIILGIVAVILGCAIWYIVKSKKQGVKCIGCPASGCCGKQKHQDGDCGCHSQGHSTEH